ncbi:MAG: YlbF family regulator [Clostridia bacterium]|nr:YlbF family regulator [Clostridia bacterium]
MTVLEAVRNLGEAIQKDERFLRYAKAKLANDENSELQELIGRFNMVRMNLDEVMAATERDEEKVQALNEELRKVYLDIMAKDSMVEYNASKVDLDGLLNDVNSVIMQCVDGADPKTVEPEVHSCTGSCESCGGCH